MSVLGTTDAPLDIFGGLVTDMAPADLPAGASPDCADVAFQLGAVKTRPGLLSMYTPIAGNPTVNYLKTYIQPNLTQTLLALDSAGRCGASCRPERSRRSLPASSPARTRNRPRSSAASTSPFPTANSASTSRANTTARIFDRVSQVGPGGGPTSARRCAAGVAHHHRRVADRRGARERRRDDHDDRGAQLSGRTDVTIAGVTDTSFDGVFVIASVPSVTTFTFLQGGRELRLRRRYGHSHAANVRGRAPSRCLLPDAPGLFHAALAADFLDRGGRTARDRHRHSAGARRHERRRARFGVHGFRRRHVLLHHGPEQHAQHDHRRQYDDQRDARFLGYRSARRSLGRFAFSAGGAGRMRRRDRLFLAAVLVGRAQQARQFRESQLRWRLERQYAAGLDAPIRPTARADCWRRARSGAAATKSSATV